MKNSDKVLFLDACSPSAQVGILHKNEWISYFRSEDEALQSLFQGIENNLKMAGLTLPEIDKIAYCEGPGSLLGVRVASMIIRGWKELEIFKEKKIYTYNSFRVSLELVKKLYNTHPSYYIVSGVRAGRWNILSSEEPDHIYEIDESELKELKGDKWYFKQKKPLTKIDGLELRDFDYNLKNCSEIFTEEKCLKEVGEANALVLNEADYKKWDFKRHLKEN